MSTAVTPSELDILSDVVHPDEPAMSEEHARFVPGMRISEQAQSRIRELLQRNNRGEITSEERALLDRFLRVGQFVDLLQAKARLTLSKKVAGK